MMNREEYFFIGVASSLVGMHPTSLRKYERAGILQPFRTIGKVRLYSQENVSTLRQIKYLVEHWGVDIEGLQLALEATQQLHDLWELMETCDDPSKLRRQGIATVQAILQLMGDVHEPEEPHNGDNTH